jgi:uncharacterized surface protein with fasciclin (FAS1) repeats
MNAMRLTATIAFSLFALTTSAEEIRFVGKSVMFSDYRIIRSLLDSRDHKSLMKAVRAVGLEQPLLHAGVITVFAPTDAAFAALEPDRQDELVKHPRTDAVARVLACHIVADPRYAGRKLADMMDNRESLDLPTLGKCVLTVRKAGGHFTIAHKNGQVARVTDSDIAQSNGMIQIVDEVFLP